MKLLPTMDTAKEASFKLSGFSSSNTKRRLGEGTTIAVVLPYVRQGPFRVFPWLPSNHAPSTASWPPPLYGEVPTAWFIETVRAAGTIWPSVEGAVDLPERASSGHLKRVAWF